MKIQQKGFSAIEAVVVILIVAILCAGGWFVWQSQQQNSKKPANTSATTSQNKTTEKEYTNTAYGFSFKYPSTWTVKEDLQDTGNRGLEGAITAIAPSGTTVHFDLSQGGKGGSCAPKDSDRPDYTSNCSTLRILSSEKTQASTEQTPIYLTKRRITDPIENGSNSKYFIALSTVDESLKVNTPIIDYDGGVFQWLTLNSAGKIAYLDAYITEKNGTAGTSYGTTADYFDSKAVTEGLPVLASLKL